MALNKFKQYRVPTRSVPAKSGMTCIIIYYYSDIFPVIRAQHGNYATLLAGSSINHNYIESPTVRLLVGFTTYLRELDEAIA